MSSQKYDALVIGGGLGGLTAAAALSHAGLRVRLFEKHSIPGGYATSFSRGRFDFEVSLHALSGIGEPQNRGPIYHILDELGVAKRLDFVFLNDVFHSITGDAEFVMPREENAIVDALSSRFPHERRGLVRVFRLLLNVGNSIEHMRARNSGMSSVEGIARYPVLGYAAGMTLGRLLNREVRDPEARLAISQLWGYFGCPPSTMSLLLYGAAMHSYVRYRPVMPRGKSQAISDALVDVIRENGGEVSLSTAVVRIRCQEGRVTGVETAQGEVCDAPIVVSNAAPITTLKQLLPPDCVPATLIDQLSRIAPSVSSFNVYLGLNTPSKNVGIRSHEIYLNRDFDTESHYAAGTRIGPLTSISVTAYDVLDPDASPSGTGLVTLTVPVEGAPWERLDAADYTETRDRVAQSLIADLDARFPGFSSHIEMQVLATPLTNARYTANPSGAMYGYAQTAAQSPAFRFSQQGHIEGLWYAGAWTRPGGGYQSVINSGRFTADMILRTWQGTRTTAWLQRTDPYRRIPLTPIPVGARLRALGGFFKDGKVIRDAMQTNRRPVDLSAPVRVSPEQTDAAVERVHASSFRAVVSEVTREAPDAVTLHLTREDAPFPPFVPGQYFSLSLQVGNQRHQRPYSVSSAATDTGRLSFTVKKKAGGFLSHAIVDDLKVGDSVFLSGPWGGFQYAPLSDPPHLVAIAAGSGITPFVSMLRSFGSGYPRPEKMTLLYGSRDASHILFRDVLAQAQASYDWFRVRHVLSRPADATAEFRGRIRPEILPALLSDIDEQNAVYLICGPEAMMSSHTESMPTAGISGPPIRTEIFGPQSPHALSPHWPQDVPQDTRFRIHNARVGRDAQVAAIETILGSLERVDMAPASRCRASNCNSCRMHLVQGKVFDATRHEVVAGPAHIRTCMCFPLSDIKLI